MNAKRAQKRQPAGAIHPQIAACLLSDASTARATGEMTWSSRKALDVRGCCDVITGVASVSGGLLQMQYNKPRAWHVRLIYLVDADSTIPLRRVCVNGTGHGFGRATHMHTYRSDGTESCVEVDDSFPECPISSGVTDAQRCMMFMAFARLCHISTDELTWVDPPKEV